MEMLTRKAFLHTDFESNGYGPGSGSGSPFGSGFGSGCGEGSFSGVGRGHGAGGGYISGSGRGYGCFSSAGCDKGSGGSHDFGDGIKSFNGQSVDMIDHVPTILTCIIGNVAKGFIVRPDFSLVPTFVYKQDNKFSHGETPHKAREALFDKLFNRMSTGERIAAFCEEFRPGVKRPAMDFFSWHHRLTGSCEQGRKEFARQHDVDIDNDEMTPEEFFKLTRDSYGSEIIRQTEKEFAAVSKD